MTILEDLKSGRLVVVPREPDDTMIEAAYDALINGQEWGRQVAGADVFAAMLTASPSHTAALIALVEGMEADLAAACENHAHATIGWERERGLREAAEAKADTLREALAAVKAAILSDMNGMAIQCTIFMPGGDAPPHETMVDFIDRALTQEQNNG